MSSVLSQVAVFANANGGNEYLDGFLKTLAGAPGLKMSVLSLSEELPAYASFPNSHRKERIEEILQEAARMSADEVAKTARAHGIQCGEPLILEGKFPQSVLEWSELNQPSLILKQSLPWDGGFGYASKGDIKLTRISPAPVLLAHAEIKKGDSVVVGIAPHPQDLSSDAFCVRLINTAADFARLLGGELHVVNAWDLWGAHLLRSRMSEQELLESIEEERSKAEAAVARVVGRCKTEGVTVKKILGRGDSVKVLSAAIDLESPGLVVLGSHANEGVKGALLGNTAETVARKKHTSVLIVK